jgi:hypothetical protein
MKNFILFFALSFLIQVNSVNAHFGQNRGPQTSSDYKFISAKIRNCMSKGHSLENCSSKLLENLGLPQAKKEVLEESIQLVDWQSALKKCMKKFSMTDCLIDFVGHKDEANPIIDPYEMMETNISI